MRRHSFVVILLTCMTVALAAQPQQNVVRVSPEVSMVLRPGWTVTDQLRDSIELERLKGKQGEAHMLVAVERRLGHADALQRLVEIAQEQPEGARATVIAGWPAIERTYSDPVPRTGEAEEVEKDFDAQPRETLWATTAIAADDLVIRLETMLRPGASSSAIEDALSMGRAVQPAKRGDDAKARGEAETIDRAIAAPPKKPIATSGEPAKLETPATKTGGGQSTTIGVPVNARGGVGELEVAASADGQNVVVAANPGYAFSNNGGTSFTPMGGTPAPFPRDGDPSLAVGATGNFYYAFIGYPNGTAAAGGVTGCSNSVSVSPTGQTFTWRSHAVLCTNMMPVCFPDQEHIAADRVNTVGGNDQVYVVWRNFTNAAATTCRFGSGSVTPRITCSSDSGTTWPTTVSLTGGDFPRVTAGQDGFVYVAYRAGGNMMLDKYSSCSAGLVRQGGFPRVVSAFTDVTCPVPGLDRCNDGNILSSPTAAVDDLNPNHIYFAYANSTGATNANVIVADSTDGGTTFPRSVVVNNAVTGRRFAPWVSAYGGVAYVSWYDRSMATTTNDMTRYFGGSASVRGGNLVAGAQIDISQATDPQCASGWPCGSRATGDSESCTTQPQVAGLCLNAMGGGSAVPCDFSTPLCPGGETCQVWGGGCPKYGDYNGNAVRNGRWYVAWASATAPPGVTAPGAGVNVYSDAILTPSNFFVRDWTTNASSHDLGEEPSTNPWFFVSSDVWSQTTATPNAPVNDFVQGDLARKGMGALGDNYAFVRVSRRAAAAPTTLPQEVRAQLYSADYGLGTPFVTVGAPQPLTFAATDLTRTLNPGIPWHVDETASTHVCLAVEINTAPPDMSDPLAAPSIAGNSPGPADPLITIDNNKAQRNIDTVPGTSGGSGASGFAVIANGDDAARVIDVFWEIPGNLCERLHGVRGSLDGRAFDMPCKGSFSTNRLDPGAHQWLEVTFASFDAREGELLPIQFAERGPGPAGTSNGFVLAARGESLPGLIEENLAEHLLTFRRFQGVRGAKESLAQFKLARSSYWKNDPSRYQRLLKTQRKNILRYAAAVDALAKNSPINTRAKAEAFDKAVRANAKPEEIAARHNALIRAIDAQLTEIRLRQGKKK